MTIFEASEILAISPNQTRAMVRSGRLRAERTADGYDVDAEDVRAEALIRGALVAGEPAAESLDRLLAGVAS
ncbi:MAG: hypothetical protein ACO4CT_18360 [Planctomycetota bacterium]